MSLEVYNLSLTTSTQVGKNFGEAIGVIPLYWLSADSGVLWDWRFGPSDPPLLLEHIS